MTEYYLDNAASTKPVDAALAAFTNAAKTTYANQEALGGMGKTALQMVRKAGEEIAAGLAPGWHTYFYNTATDAVSAAAAAHFSIHPGTAAVTTRAEHPALLKALERHAGRIIYIPLDRAGHILFDKSLLSEEVTFCGIHHVNAETGAIQDCSEIRKTLGTDICFLADTTQSACKLPLPSDSADLMTVSGAKIGAPCGAVLLTRSDTALEKALQRIRGVEHAVGRCVPAAAAALAAAVHERVSVLQACAKSAAEWKTAVLKELEGINFIETVPESSPYILHLLFPKYQGAVLVRLLGAMGISVSSGSACLSETREPSAVLRAMGYTRDLSFSALRISLGPAERPDAKKFAAGLKAALKNY